MTHPNHASSSNRKWMVIAGIVAAVVVAILIALSVNQSSDGGTPDNLAGVADAVELFDGVPQNGLEIGNPDAPVTIVEYLDAQCPHCAAAASGVVPRLVEQYVRTGQAKLELKPIAFLGNDSEKGALVIIAAGDQNRAGEFADILFANQGAENSGWLSDAMIDAIAKELNIDAGKLNSNRNAGATKQVFGSIAAAAQTDQVQSTPTFIVKGPKGQHEIVNRENLGEFTQAITAVR